MKKLLLGAIALLSVNAYSQSYVVLNSGVTLTTDVNGYVYDFNNFVLPYKVKGKGGNFLLEDKNLVTIDANGLLYKNSINVKKFKGSGLNYFISDSGLFSTSKLYTVDDKGFYYEFTQEGYNLKDVSIFGGNYFVLDGDMTIIRRDGTFKVIRLEGIDLSKIKSFPGSYFISEIGQFFTVTDEGKIKTFHKNFKEIKKAGGNYFIDEKGWIHTITTEGELISPIIPFGFDTKKLVNFGSNYMIDSDNNIYTVDAQGNINQRMISVDISRSRIFSL
ncbi:MAG TPA: hypothetical protein VKZ84_03535 [Bacteriovoracaceae bacterium]|nr:hypothetical protein [Bacteriovoracaceae bacterium]